MNEEVVIGVGDLSLEGGIGYMIMHLFHVFLTLSL